MVGGEALDCSDTTAITWHGVSGHDADEKAAASHFVTRVRDVAGNVDAAVIDSQDIVNHLKNNQFQL